MASAPSSPGSPDLPLPSTPLTDSSPPPTDSSLPPPSDDSSPPAPSDSSPPAPSDSSPLPPSDLSAPPPSDLSAPPPSTLPIPPPLEVAPPPIDISPPPPPPLEPLPPPPVASSPPSTDTSPPPIASFPPPTDTSPPPTSSEIFPPPPPPPAAVPTPAAIPLSPPPASSPPAPPSPDSVNSPPPPPSSDTTFSPPPPVNSSSPLTPSPPVKSSKHSGSTPGTSTPSTLNTSGDDTLLQNSSSDGDQSAKTGIAIGVVAAFVVICFMLVIVFVRRRRKRHDRYNSVFMLPSQFASPQDSASSFMKPTPSVGSVVVVGGGGGGSSGSEFISSSLDSGILGNSKTWFSYEDLNVATNGFASQNILGAGGFGCVYKGFLQDGRVVAVKKLKDNGGQGDREFKAEVETISRVHHRHLVSLVGYCVTDYQRLLVFEFLPNNTLDYHLHAPNKPVMEWSLRVKAACGSARGLAYLHEDCHPKIIHRDIKSANILLDHNFEAKVADFGLAKLAQELDLNTHVSTRVMGTFGYMAPEYASSGKLTEKSDVFSFGVVLLEVITGRKPVDQSQDESLVEWARPLMSEALDSQNFDQLADPRLQGNYNRGEMFRMIEAAAACVRHSSSKRPKMSQVVRALDTISELSDISNGMKPGESGIFNSREQSAQIRMFQRMAFGSQDFSSEHGNSQSSWASGGRSGVV